MIRLLARAALSLLANAVGLMAAALLLPGFSIAFLPFAIAVAIFTLSTVLLEPLVTRLARRYASFLMGGIALVTTFIGLVVTTLMSDGISIMGVGTWVSATFIIWLCAIIASVVLPLFLFRNVLSGENGKS